MTPRVAPRVSPAKRAVTAPAAPKAPATADTGGDWETF
jgi:methyl-accepting chemotaxis protein-1 (serine sensor receptor)